MLKVILPPWVVLGFYRGVKFHDYEYKQKYIRYEKYKDAESVVKVFYYIFLT